MNSDPAYHYPPDLLNLLVDAIAHIVRSNEEVVEFFRRAGLSCPKHTFRFYRNR
jgi:hypothetical protein